MRICYLPKVVQSQKTLRDRSENANLLSSKSLPKPKNTMGSQWKCEFDIVGKPSKAKKHYGIAVKMRICYLCKAFQSQKTLRDRSENANLLSSQSLPKPKNTMGSQWKCEFAIFGKPSKAKKHYGIAVKMRICYLPKASQSQKTLWDRNENANLLSS